MALTSSLRFHLSLQGRDSDPKEEADFKIIHARQEYNFSKDDLACQSTFFRAYIEKTREWPSLRNQYYLEKTNPHAARAMLRYLNGEGYSFPIAAQQHLSALDFHGLIYTLADQYEIPALAQRATHEIKFTLPSALNDHRDARAVLARVAQNTNLATNSAFGAAMAQFWMLTAARRGWSTVDDAADWFLLRRRVSNVEEGDIPAILAVHPVSLLCGRAEKERSDVKVEGWEFVQLDLHQELCRHCGGAALEHKIGELQWDEEFEKNLTEVSEGL